jgi:type II secretory pathway pseudopilin PulG
MYTLSQQGFSIIEIIVAFAIFLLALSGVIIVSFGNQSTAMKNELNNKAIYHAKEGLENAYIQSITAFNELKSISAKEINTIFLRNISVTPISPCAKRVESKVSWQENTPVPQVLFASVYTSTFLSQSFGGDCATQEVGDWEKPSQVALIEIEGQGGTDIDVQNSIIYITSNEDSDENDDFYIYSFNSGDNSYTMRGSLNTGKGLTTIDVAGAYVFAGRDSSNGQLIVIDVENPNNPILRWEVSIPVNDEEESEPEPLAIHYQDGYVYLGTKKISGEPEFHIFDARGDLNTTAPVHIGDVEIGHSVYDITIGHGNAYLATRNNDRELAVVNVVDPTQPSLWIDAGYNAPGSTDGTSVALLDNILYLGRYHSISSSVHDFFVLNVTDILDGSISNDGLYGSIEFGSPNSSRVTDIVVRSTGQKTLAFLSLDDSSDGFKILDITEPSSIAEHPNCSNIDTAKSGTAMDMESGRVFILHAPYDEIRVFESLDELCS